MPHGSGLVAGCKDKKKAMLLLSLRYSLKADTSSETLVLSEIWQGKSAIPI
jgi:hypothetical protein